VNESLSRRDGDRRQAAGTSDGGDGDGNREAIGGRPTGGKRFDVFANQVAAAARSTAGTE
jgi:hypothetical protein